MRITGGEARGRLLKSPPSGLRPTQDRVRAAICSILAGKIPGARVLDLFAGTGAYGLEAWSRGAAAVTWVESAPASFRALADNLKALRIPSTPDFRPVRSDVFRLLARPPLAAPFDIVFADPPYAPAREESHLARLASLLLSNSWLAPRAVFVFETDAPSSPPALPAPFTPAPLLDRTYGSTRLLLWQFLP